MQAWYLRSVEPLLLVQIIVFYKQVIIRKIGIDNTTYWWIHLIHFIRYFQGYHKKSTNHQWIKYSEFRRPDCQETTCELQNVAFNLDFIFEYYVILFLLSKTINLSFLKNAWRFFFQSKNLDCIDSSCATFLRKRSVMKRNWQRDLWWALPSMLFNYLFPIMISSVYPLV